MNRTTWTFAIAALLAAPLAAQKNDCVLEVGYPAQLPVVDVTVVSSKAGFWGAVVGSLETAPITTPLPMQCVVVLGFGRALEDRYTLTVPLIDVPQGLVVHLQGAAFSDDSPKTPCLTEVRTIVGGETGDG